ncbi:hypothetical protein KIN20_036591 [Parelaphostrongylus tenuis]|uniref:Uncharacterized protein n=1 Tax=Parelaphostrongylus tenuis TaxID=148309 RepID=A0AAD5RCS1_PARTN|nr:hypothetical protein KIN20_036591 [Parelaphostrongylus tenuis]
MRLEKGSSAQGKERRHQRAICRREKMRPTTTGVDTTRLMKSSDTANMECELTPEVLVVERALPTESTYA